MEQQIKETIEEILDVCTKANIVENPENLIHVLIAYFNCPEIKTDVEYAINAIIAHMIHDITGNIKGDEFKMTTSELQRLCKCIMIKNEKEEAKPCTIFKDTCDPEPDWSYDNTPLTEEEEKYEADLENAVHEACRISDNNIGQTEIPRRVRVLSQEKEVIEV